MRVLKEGEVVGGLVVKHRLGSGGMGDVYLAHDEKLGVNRALKLICLTGPGFTGARSELEEYRKRFAREARVLARLRHPNIVSIHAIGEIDDLPYLVMSYFPSVDAREWLNKERPSLARVRRVGLQLARALAHAHENGVLHRDIKLANVLVGKDDEALLIDFGLAKHESDGDLTRVGRTMGTFSYLAPEYVIGSTDGTEKHSPLTDLWSMGCLLYVLTCNEPAFSGKDESRLLRRVARAQFLPVKHHVPDVPEQWATLIHQLMEPVPARRIQSAAELAAKLESLELQINPQQPVAATRAPDEFADAPPPVPPGVHQAPQEQRAAPAPVELPAKEPNAPAEPPAAQANAQAVRAAPRSVTPENTRSIFDEATTGTTSDAASLLAQPSFQLPLERGPSGRASARRKLVIPVIAAGLVLALGSGVIVGIGRLGHQTRSTTYVDPDELQRRQRASSELDDLAQEKSRRAALHTLELAPVPQPLPLAKTPLNVDEPRPERPTPSRDAKRASPSRATLTTVAVAAPESNPFLQRYGTRTNYNTSSSPSAAPINGAGGAPQTTTTASAAGIRIPVRVTSEIASAPLGPVIAIVQAATKVGGVEIPRGAEIHGRVTGAEGPRVLLEFSFAVLSGRNVPLKAIALGQDGRAGVPGAKNVGGPSDVAAGAAAGGAQALLEGAAALVGNDIAAGAIRGASGPVVNKAGRLDNEEDLVVASAGSRFLVYIESFP